MVVFSDEHSPSYEEEMLKSSYVLNLKVLFFKRIVIKSDLRPSPDVMVP